MYSLLDLLSPNERPPEEALREDLSPERGADPGGFELVMRRKRRAALLKAMLESQGYDDLARMAGIRERGGGYVG
jgi:hypothetical protein